MASYRGTVCDAIEPTPGFRIPRAEIDPKKLEIHYDSWVVEATSKDGFVYQGSYRSVRGLIDPQRTLRLQRYDGIDGSVVLVGDWNYKAEQGAKGAPRGFGSFDSFHLAKRQPSTFQVNSSE